jgi:hypothetical protein
MPEENGQTDGEGEGQAEGQGEGEGQVSAEGQATATAVPLIDENGKLAENWRESLSEDIRHEKSLQTFGDLEGMAKTIVHQRKMIGNDNTVIVPGETATDAEIDAFHRAMGRPDTVEDYQIKHMEGIDVDEVMEKKFKEFAFKKGMNPKLLQELIDFDDARIADTIDEINNRIEQSKLDAETKCKEKWGDDFDRRLTLCNRLVMENTEEGEERASVLQSIGNNPYVANMLSNIAAKFVEHKVIQAEPGVPTPAEALTKIEELRNTPGYISGELAKDNPKRSQQITEEINKLYHQVHPTK